MNPGIAVRSTDEVDVVLQGPNNELLYYFLLSGGNWVESFTIAPGNTIAPAGSISSAPAIFVRSSGEADVVAQGPNGELLYYWAWPGTNWNTHAIAPAGSISSPPAIFVRTSGEADVVAKGPNNELLYYWAMPGGSWNPNTIAPAGSISSPPAIAVHANGEADIVAFAAAPAAPPANLPSGATAGFTLLYWWATPGGPWQSTSILGIPQASANPQPNETGYDIYYGGTGFPANSDLSVFLDGLDGRTAPLSLGWVPTDAYGRFTGYFLFTFYVPGPGSSPNAMLRVQVTTDSAITASTACPMP